jgi:hypothetical protein
VQMKLAGTSQTTTGSLGTLQSEPQYLDIKGAEDPSMRLSLSTETLSAKPFEIPALTYKINYVAFEYWSGVDGSSKPSATEEKNLWCCPISTESLLTVLPEKIVQIEMGKPQLSIWATAPELQSDTQPKQPQTTFSKKDGMICLYSKITGPAGEQYFSFSQGSRQEVRPTYRILDATGNPGSFHTIGQPGVSFGWYILPDTKPGKYTIIMEQETGPLAGKLEGRLEITIE